MIKAIDVLTKVSDVQRFVGLVNMSATAVAPSDTHHR